MANEDNFSYEDWKDYLKTDKDMKEKWKSLISLWKNVRQSIRESFDGKTKNELLEDERKRVWEAIFKLLSRSNKKLDFSWETKTITKNRGYGEHQEYYIYCPDIVSNTVFGRIKTIKWVANMHWDSIDEYLIPVSNKIWALKMALRTSITPEARKEALSYKEMKTKVKTIDEKKWKGVDDEKEIRREIEEEEMRKNIEDAECNYGPNSRDTVNGEWNVVFNEAFLNKQQFNDDKNSSSEE